MITGIGYYVTYDIHLNSNDFYRVNQKAISEIRNIFAYFHEFILQSRAPTGFKYSNPQNPFREPPWGLRETDKFKKLFIAAEIALLFIPTEGETTKGKRQSG